MAATEQEPITLTSEQTKILSELILSDKSSAILEKLSALVRSFEGKPVDASDVITRLINIKNRMERSRFPTYPLLAKQVYLRLIAYYTPEAQACKVWADMEASALIAYKGENWDAYVEMAKAQTAPSETQQFYFGKPEQQQAQLQAPMKKHWWTRTPKQPQEQSEFKSE